MYKVGQVVYTVLESKQQIVPIRIVEEVSVKTLNGETISYKGLLPNRKNSKISLEKLDKIYTSIEEVKSELIKKATDAISNMISETSKIENKYFRVEKEETNEVLLEKNIKCQNNNTNVKIDLGQGLTGNINIDSLNNFNMDQKKT